MGVLFSGHEKSLVGQNINVIRFEKIGVKFNKNR
jgi:hypothetical protein